MLFICFILCSNNTNKLSPQEPGDKRMLNQFSSNNTNKLSPQEQWNKSVEETLSSNNTNKLSPQELRSSASKCLLVQIIQINLVLKNVVTLGMI